MKKRQTKPSLTEKENNLDWKINFRSPLTKYDEKKPKKPVNTEYYDILGVEPNATTKQIKDSYKKKSSQLHPDRQKSEYIQKERSKEYFSRSQSKLNEAKEVLTDPFKRAQYDRFGKILNPNIHERRIVLKDPKYFDNIDQYEKYLDEQELFIRSKWFEILTDSSTQHSVHLFIPEKGKNNNVYNAPMAPILSVFMLESFSNFSLPISKYDVISIGAMNRQMIDGADGSKTISYKHFFKNKENHNLDFLGLNLEYLIKYGVLSIQFQKILNMERKLVFSTTQDFLAYPFFGYVGPDFYIERRLFKKTSGYIGLNFPYHRRCFYVGLINFDKEIKFVASIKSMKLTLEKRLFNLDFIKSHMNASIGLSRSRLYDRKKNELFYFHNLDFQISILRKVVRDTYVGLGWSIGINGSNAKLFLKRGKHKASIVLFTQTFLQTGVGLILPAAIFSLGLFLFKKYKKKKENKNGFKSWKKNFVRTYQSRKEWFKEMDKIKEIAKTIQKKEEENNGLIIKNAKYGVLIEKDVLKNDEEKKADKLKWIDVTASVQCLVKNNSLNISSETKSILHGFFDVAPNQEKKLTIKYLWKNVEYTACYDDEETISLPIDPVYLYKNENKFE